MSFGLVLIYRWSPLYQTNNKKKIKHMTNKVISTIICPSFLEAQGIGNHILRLSKFSKGNSRKKKKKAKKTIK